MESSFWTIGSFLQIATLTICSLFGLVIGCLLTVFIPIEKIIPKKAFLPFPLGGLGSIMAGISSSLAFNISILFGCAVGTTAYVILVILILWSEKGSKSGSG